MGDGNNVLPNVQSLMMSNSRPGQRLWGGGGGNNVLPNVQSLMMSNSRPGQRLCGGMETMYCPTFSH